ncbi:MAG: hypothetical protein LBS97_02310 [Treponema sp.]|jgi:hypothetical protein|nr:hypothetical protein [Treponema sp.]
MCVKKAILVLCAAAALFFSCVSKQPNDSSADEAAKDAVNRMERAIDAQ